MIVIEMRRGATETAMPFLQKDGKGGGGREETDEKESAGRVLGKKREEAGAASGGKELQAVTKSHVVTGSLNNGVLPTQTGQ